MRELLRLIAFVVVLLPTTLFAQTNSDVRLYFFTMQGCGPCAQVAPLVDQLVSAGCPITTVDARLQSTWAKHYQVRTTPTFVMTVGNREVSRHSGVLDAPTLQQWLATTAKTHQQTRPPDSEVAKPSATIARLTQQSGSETSTANIDLPVPQNLTDTVHSGTRHPANEVERRALQATVRLRVEDPEGISFATGTIIHTYKGESLVMTCGHVFRDSKGKGVITADVNWLESKPTTVPGELIDYDAGPRDVALVAIRTGFDLPAVMIGPRNIVVGKGDQVFSIGCDKGSPPTIRRTCIKNTAKYDGAEKYDIFGRPVDGRSGGGLFTAGGQMIGVCNAAAVDEDEGIFTSIGNLHDELVKSDLAHLFKPTSVENDFEAIVILRSKANPAQTRTVIIDRPTTEFLNVLAESQPQPRSTNRELARLRDAMPEPSVLRQSSETLRAQSPR